MQIIIINLLLLVLQKANEFNINLLAKRRARARLSALFIALTFKNYERCFLYEILILIKT